QKSRTMSAIDINNVADEAISPSKTAEAVKDASPAKRKAEEIVEEVEVKKARVDEPAEVAEEKEAPEAEATEEKTSEAVATEEKEEAKEEAVEKPEAEEAKEADTTTPESASDKERDQARKVISSAFAKKEIENAEDKTKSVEEKIFGAKGSDKTEFLRFAYSVAFNIVAAKDFASALEDAEKEINIDDISEPKISKKVNGFFKSDDAEFDFDALTVSSQ
ncbi:hypothetical protein PRIPAC_92050, partial [Pristionchus pacificus]